MYAKNVKFPSGFLCSSFVEVDTKEAFCFSNIFLHTLDLEIEKKTRGKIQRNVCQSINL